MTKNIFFWSDIQIEHQNCTLLFEERSKRVRKSLQPHLKNIAMTTVSKDKEKETNQT